MGGRAPGKLLIVKLSCQFLAKAFIAEDDDDLLPAGAKAAAEPTIAAARVSFVIFDDFE